MDRDPFLWAIEMLAVLVLVLGLIAIVALCVEGFL